ISKGLVNGRTRRLLFGYTYDENRYSIPVGVEPVPAVPPPDRTLSYPWIGFHEVQDTFITGKDVDQIQRTGDLHLGRQSRGRLGYSSPAFGADRSATIVSGLFTQGLNPGDGQMLFLSVSADGRLTDSGAENVLASVSGRWFVRDLGGQMTYVGLFAD